MLMWYRSKRMLFSCCLAVLCPIGLGCCDRHRAERLELKQTVSALRQEIAGLQRDLRAKEQEIEPLQAQIRSGIERVNGKRRSQDEVIARMIAECVQSPGPCAAFIVGGGAVATLLDENMDDDLAAIAGIAGAGAALWCLWSSENRARCAGLALRLHELHNDFEDFESQIATIDERLEGKRSRLEALHEEREALESAIERREARLSTATERLREIQ